AGTLVFAGILWAVGLDTLIDNLRQAGWILLPVLGVYVIVYACYNAAWMVLLLDEPRRPGFWASFAITTSAFGINYITPVVNAGGEPYRAAATAAWTGTSRATGATVLYYLLHALSSFALWLAALVAGLIVLPRTAWHLSGIAILAVAILGLAALVLSAHRRGVLEALLNLLTRIPGLRRLGGALERHRGSLVEMDVQIRQFWHERPGRFAAAFGLECAGRGAQVLEFWLICRGVGVPISYAEALCIGGLAALALNAFFFMPFELGSKEGSLIGIFLALGYSAPLAVYASVVSRLREFTWIGIGLALMWARGAAPVPAGAVLTLRQEGADPVSSPLPGARPAPPPP
ncbi:MAG: flippase-like domain-containing protein, partial [Gemmatimonadales bacterium]|nr:flippase-like domain-containing protein [Gemmatimonadales bacterium]